MASIRRIGISAFLKISAGNAIASMRNASRAFKDMAKSASTAKDKIRTVNTSFAAFRMAGLGVAAGIGITVRSFASFDAATAALKSRLEATDGPISKFTKKALDLGKQTKFTGTEILGAMEGLKKFGLSGAEVMKAVTPVTRLATNENISLAKAAEQVLAANKAMGGEQTFAQTLDLLSFVSGNSAATVGRLVEGVKLAGPAAQQMGVQARDLVGSLGLLNSAAMFGSRAGTALGAAISRIAEKSKEGRLMIGKYAVRIEQAKNGGVDLKQTLLNIATAFKEIQRTNPGKIGKLMAGKEAAKVFGTRAGRGIGTFLKFVKGRDGEQLKKIFLTPQKSIDGFTERIFKIRQRNIRDDFIKFTSALNTLSVAIGRAFGSTAGGLIRGATQFIGELANAVQFFTKNPKALSQGVDELFKSMGDKKGHTKTAISIVQGLWNAFTATVGVIRTLGTVIGGAFTTIKSIANALGLSDSAMLQLTATMVGVGAVIGTLSKAFFALKIAGAVALSPFAVKLAIIAGGIMAVKKGITLIQNSPLAMAWIDFFAKKIEMLRQKLIQIGILKESAASNQFTNRQVAVNAARQRIQNLAAVGRNVGSFQNRQGQRVNITRDVILQQARETLARRGVQSKAEQDKILVGLRSELAKIPVTIGESTQKVADAALKGTKEVAKSVQSMRLEMRVGPDKLGAAVAKQTTDMIERGASPGGSRRLDGMGLQRK